MSDRKPLASLSLDLDNLWSYMKTHGDPGWESFPSYLDLAVPHALRCLEELNLTITFFVVGQDAALEMNEAALRSIAGAGHEIGNHSFHHEPWLHLYSEADIDRELGRTEEALGRVVGCKPVGFRGPGYSISPATLRTLERRGYVYDASTLPTFIGPLARAYYFATSTMDREEKRRRGKLFGTVRDGLRPIRAYRWQSSERDGRGLVEIPVTTMPLVRAPFHISYIMYLSAFTTRLAIAYFRLALLSCRSLGVQPSLLLHPLDFIGRDDLPALSFFPGMSLDGQRKRTLVAALLRIYAELFELVPVGRHAAQLSDMATLPTMELGSQFGTQFRT